MGNKWVLRSTDGTFRRALQVTPGAVKTVGRGPTADYTLDTALVSRLHCRLSATDAELKVEDLDSTNGTYVNDRRIGQSPLALASGDRLRLGRLELSVTQEMMGE